MKSAGALGAIGCRSVAVFQVALAVGAPLGRPAWGEGHERLARNLRIASAVAAIVWVVAALVILAYVGFDASPIPSSVASWATWVLAGLLLIGAFFVAIAGG